MSHPTTSTTNIHVRDGAKVNVTFKAAEHEYSDGPYAVVDIKLGGVDLTIFPGAAAADLAAAFARTAAELAAFAASSPKVIAIRD